MRHDRIITVNVAGQYVNFLVDSMRQQVAVERYVAKAGGSAKRSAFAGGSLVGVRFLCEKRGGGCQCQQGQ